MSEFFHLNKADNTVIDDAYNDTWAIIILCWFSQKIAAVEITSSSAALRRLPSSDFTLSSSAVILSLSFVNCSISNLCLSRSSCKQKYKGVNNKTSKRGENRLLMLGW